MSVSESRRGKDLTGVRFLPKHFRVLEVAAEELNVKVPVLIRARLGLPLPADPPVSGLDLEAAFRNALDILALSGDTALSDLDLELV